MANQFYLSKNKIMKTNRTIYWISTGFIFLFEGVMPALTSQTEMAKEGIRHLGYPAYFGVVLTVFKVLGALAITIPTIPARLKEWAYAGLAFDFIFAFISYSVVEGFGGLTFFPLFVLCILIISYVSYHKMRNEVKLPTATSY
jgi:DoxX-like family